MIKVLYLILNFKTYSDTIRVTNELLQTERTDFKILIVDNASPNESYNEISKFFAGNELVEVILSPENGGYAKGNNFGLRYAKKYNPEYVCIMNNDVHFSWETINALIDIYPKLDSAALITPIQYLPNNKIAPLSSLKVPNFLYDLRLYSLFFRNKAHKYISNSKFDNVQQIGLVPGAFMLANYNVLKKVGFFNECTFLFCEERFLAKEIELKGYKNYAILDLKYIHEHSKTISTETSRKRQQDLMFEGRSLYIQKYGKYPKIEVLILKIARKIYDCELKIISIIKKACRKS